jgi:hypothetical protein
MDRMTHATDPQAAVGGQRLAIGEPIVRGIDGRDESNLPWLLRN